MVDQDVGMDACANFGESRLKLSEASFWSFSNVDDFRQEVNSDVISSEFVDTTCVKVRVVFGISRSNRSRDIRLTHFVATNNDDDTGRRTL